MLWLTGPWTGTEMRAATCESATVRASRIVDIPPAQALLPSVIGLPVAVPQMLQTKWKDVEQRNSGNRFFKMYSVSMTPVTVHVDMSIMIRSRGL